MIVPFRVNTLIIRPPWVNLGILGLNVLVMVAVLAELLPESLIEQMVLTSWDAPLGFVGSLFLHAGIAHLIGNMIVLWVFGNALNGVMHHPDFLFSYLFCGIVADAVHLAVDGTPAVGASGAICGLMGMYLAIYPKNEISCFYWFFRPGTFELKGYLLILGWFIWDLVSAVTGEPGVAYWAHVGGTVAGFGVGLVLLKLQRVHRAEYDNPTALDLFARSEPAADS